MFILTQAESADHIRPPPEFELRVTCALTYSKTDQICETSN